MAHRTPEFTAINERLFGHLRNLLGTPHVVSLTGSGTAGMEAAISNLVHWNDAAVGIDGGKFGGRICDLVSRYAGESGGRIDVEWGQAVNLEAVESALEEGVGLVAATINETSTGVMHDGAAIGKLCRKHDALFVADTITCTGSVPVPFDSWGLDVTVVGSQKCIGGPAGLAFLGLSERAIERLDSPSLYFDLRTYLAKAEGGQTPFTPAVPLHMACAEALDLVFEEGLDARYARTHALANACRAAAMAAGLEMPAAANARSDTVTAIQYPAGVDDGLRSSLKQRHNVVVAGAQDSWKGKVMRIGHMAGTTWTDMVAGWAAICVELERAGHNVDEGAVIEAMAPYAP